jgi:chromosome segregation ATPase
MAAALGTHDLNKDGSRVLTEGYRPNRSQCRHFFYRGGCHYGDKCIFSHMNSTGLQSENERLHRDVRALSVKIDVMTTQMGLIKEAHIREVTNMKFHQEREVNFLKLKSDAQEATIESLNQALSAKTKELELVHQAKERVLHQLDILNEQIHKHLRDKAALEKALTTSGHIHLKLQIKFNELERHLISLKNL